MHDLPRQKLTELLSTHGLGICDDAKRFEGLLKDLLRNGHKREIFILVSAVREGIVQELHGLTSGLPLAALTARLIRQLRDNLALDEAAARWAVESWAFAMGVKITPQVPPANKPTPAPRLIIPTASPAISSGNGIDLAAMVLQQRTKEEQEKKNAESIHQQARELADEANDYEAAIQLIESISSKWRDEGLCRSIREKWERELESVAKKHAAKVHQQAKKHAEQSRDFASAAQMIESLESKWRDANLYEKICGYRDQVARLDAGIQNAVRKGQLRFLRGRVRELLKLQPQRDDMRRLMDVLPDEPVLPKEFTNSIGMRFVLVLPGAFVMGSTEADAERPPHVVEITQPFYLGVFSVTQAEYQAVIGSNPSHFTRNAGHPVEQVSWDDAVTYCQKLNQVSAHSGGSYRLPTEAEWEYACRAGSDGAWCFGNVASLLGDYAWFDGNSDCQTHPVGRKKANAWGLYDMHGNVWERCQDTFDDTAYQWRQGITCDPLVTSGSNDHVLRGGSWAGRSRTTRSAYRGRIFPVDHSIGFRVVCELLQ